MTNFDFLTAIPQFDSFSEVAVLAEKFIHVDPSTAALNCRRAMEFAVKWMYSVDKSLEKPYQDNLHSLLNNEDFRDIIDKDIWRRLDYIRSVGNEVAHKNKKVTFAQAELCLENLFVFLDFVAYCYSLTDDDPTERNFDRKLLRAQPVPVAPKIQDVDLEKLIAENKALKDELTARRAAQQQTYVPKPLEQSEYNTRKLYIDAMLREAGWIENKNWINEVELPGMPNKSEVGFADYVLYDDAHKPLAVIEAKKTCVDVSKGRQQAKLYADLLEE